MLGMLRRALVVGVCIGLLIPLAVAEGMGDLEVRGPLVLVDGETQPTAGAFNLHSQVENDFALSLRFAEAAITHVEITFTVLAIPPGNPSEHYLAPQAIEEQRLTTGAGSMSLAHASAGAQILAWNADGLEATYGYSTAAVRALEQAVLVPFPFDVNGGSGSSTSDTYFSFVVENVYEIEAPHSILDLRGDVSFFLWNVTATVGGETLRTGISTEETGPGVREERRAFAILHFTGVEGQVISQGAHAALYSEGVLTATRASGHGVGDFRDSAAKWQFRGPFTAAGDLAFTLPPLPGKARLETADAAESRYATRYHASFATSLAGTVTESDATRIPIAQPLQSASSITGATLGALLLAGIAAYFWPALKFQATALFIPLYTRLKEPELLDNKVREHIYNIVKGNPGLSARAIHRESEHSWGTVVYHLRQLERHRLVKSKRLGRARSYYENHGKYVGMEAELATLRSSKSVLLASMIAASPGITQEDLTARAGLPQSTISYYMKKLKEANLVEERRMGKYAAYYPHPEIERLISLVTHT